jgi:hypothetical protein
MYGLVIRECRRKCVWYALHSEHGTALGRTKPMQCVQGNASRKSRLRREAHIHLLSVVEVKVAWS